MDQAKSNTSKIVSWITGIIIVVGIIYGAMGKKTTDDVVSGAGGTGVPQATEEQLNIPTSASTNNYKDGTYTATGTYDSPAGNESLKVTLTIKDTVVTDSSVVVLATNPVSKNFQGKFAAGYKQYVVGKSITSISLDKVSGASLTPKGFEDALAAIKLQAAA